MLNSQQQALLRVLDLIEGAGCMPAIKADRV
jgi:hypothetical protein